MSESLLIQEITDLRARLAASEAEVYSLTKEHGQMSEAMLDAERKREEAERALAQAKADLAKFKSDLEQAYADHHHQLRRAERAEAALWEMEREVLRMREALRQINLGRHGGLSATEMAAYAWAALTPPQSEKPKCKCDCHGIRENATLRAMGRGRGK